MIWDTLSTLLFGGACLATLTLGAWLSQRLGQTLRGVELERPVGGSRDFFVMIAGVLLAATQYFALTGVVLWRYVVSGVLVWAVSRALKRVLHVFSGGATPDRQRRVTILQRTLPYTVQLVFLFLGTSLLGGVILLWCWWKAYRASAGLTADPTTQVPIFWFLLLVPPLIGFITTNLIRFYGLAHPATDRFVRAHLFISSTTEFLFSLWPWYFAYIWFGTDTLQRALPWAPSVERGGMGLGLLFAIAVLLPYIVGSRAHSMRRRDLLERAQRWCRGFRGVSEITVGREFRLARGRSLLRQLPALLEDLIRDDVFLRYSVRRRLQSDALPGLVAVSSRNDSFASDDGFFEDLSAAIRERFANTGTPETILPWDEILRVYGSDITRWDFRAEIAAGFLQIVKRAEEASAQELGEMAGYLLTDVESRQADHFDPGFLNSALVVTTGIVLPLIVEPFGEDIRDVLVRSRLPFELSAPAIFR